MTIKSLPALALALSAFATMPSIGAVKLTALQITSTDIDGKIQGVGGHRFKTTQQGGQPTIFLVKGEDLDGEII